LVIRVGLGLLLVALGTPALAQQSWSYRGRIDVGSRHYLFDRDEGLKDDNLNLEGEVEVTWDPGGPYRVRVRPFLAVDPLESSRNRYELYDAYAEVRFPAWSVRAGQMIESWAITDTFNPIDILNRRDVERNFYDPQKLGDVIVRLQYLAPDLGPLAQPFAAVYLLPLFRETPLPGNQNRFRFDVNGDNVGDMNRDGIVTSSDIGYAARLGAKVFDADVFVFYYGGPSHLPTFDLDQTTGILRPVYYRADVIGGGFQWPIGPWLIKLETAYTSTRNHDLPSRFSGNVPPSFFQYVVGIDRTFTDLFGKNEVTVTLEFAGEDDPESTDIRGLRPFKSDLFLGVKWQFHDIRRTEVTASATVDVLREEQLYKVDFRTILWRNLWVVLSGQFVNRAPNHREDHFTVFNLFPNNSNVQVGLRYEF
jgi:hypothetical protein